MRPLALVRIQSALWILTIMSLCHLSCDARAGGAVVAWGGNNAGQLDSCAEEVVAVAAGYQQTLLLKADGTVANCGMHWEPQGITNGVYLPWDYPILLPTGLSNVIAIAAGNAHSVALRSDGTVVAWGRATGGQTNIPPDLTNVVAISSRMALKADGTVASWGDGATPPPTDWTNIVAISDWLGVRADGTVVGWGFNAEQTQMLAGLSNIVAISRGDGFSYEAWLALRADGVLVRASAFGGVTYPQSNVVTFAASRGTDHHISLAVKENDTVVGWGYNFYGGPFVPSGLSDVVQVSSDGTHSLALIGGGPPFLRNWLVNRSGVMSGKSFFRIEASGAKPMSYQWKHNGTNIPGATKPVLALTNLQPGQAGNYSVAVSNSFGGVISEEAILSLAPLHITAQPKSETNFVGGTTILSVEVQGLEPIYFQWQLDGEDIPGAEDSSLVLSEINAAQAGDYSVVVSNEYGTIVSSEAQLTLVPVLVSAQPEDRVIHVGGTAEFTVAVDGVGPISYQWTFEDTDLPGATNSILTLANVQLSQTGRYGVSLSNQYGSVRSADANLHVVTVAAWGNIGIFDYGQTNVPPGLTNVLGIAAGSSHGLALTGDGRVVGWGEQRSASIPPDLTNVLAVAGGDSSTALALRDDGTVAVWGGSTFPPRTAPEDLTNAVAVAAGLGHFLALRADGSVVGWGDNGYGEASPPADLTSAVAISAGLYHTIALQSDGTVRAWGRNNYGQTNVPIGLTNIVSVTASGYNCWALQADGTVVAWGSNGNGQADIPAFVTNVVAISKAVALKSDGTVIDWREDSYSNGPADVTNVTAIACGGRHRLALIGDGPPVLEVPMIAPDWSEQGFSVSIDTQSGRVYRLEYKNSLSDAEWSGLPLVAGTGGLVTLTDPAATTDKRVYRVRRW